MISKDEILKVGRCLDCEDRGLTANPEYEVIPVSVLCRELQELIEDFSKTKTNYNGVDVRRAIRERFCLVLEDSEPKKY